MLPKDAPSGRRLIASPPVLLALIVAVAIAISGCTAGGESALPSATIAAQPPTIAPSATPLEPTPTPVPTETAVPAPTETTIAAPATAQPTVKPSPTAPPPTATPVALPTRLKIPVINVNAQVEQVGLTSDGAMDVPKKWEDVAWYDLGARPGETGNAVIDGHLDSDVAPAVFWRLGDLKPGDHVYVARSDNTQLDFVVQKQTSFSYNDASALPIIFGPAPRPNLNLITCGGSWDRFAKNYSNRLVIFATLAAA